MNKHICPKCDQPTVGKKSRDDEVIFGDKKHEYIHCWWCSSLLFYKINGKIEWDIWSSIKKGLKHD